MSMMSMDMGIIVGMGVVVGRARTESRNFEIFDNMAHRIYNMTFVLERHEEEVLDEEFLDIIFICRFLGKKKIHSSHMILYCFYRVFYMISI